MNKEQELEFFEAIKTLQRIFADNPNFNFAHLLKFDKRTTTMNAQKHNFKNSKVNLEDNSVNFTNCSFVFNDKESVLQFKKEIQSLSI